MPRRSLARLYKDEFTGYSLAKFQQDLLAGLTVAAVALPLALAFGVASGASAAAGLVTAVPPGRPERRDEGAVDACCGEQSPLENVVCHDYVLFIKLP